jgi:hypothetical protein
MAHDMQMLQGMNTTNTVVLTSECGGWVSFTSYKGMEQVTMDNSKGEAMLMSHGDALERQATLLEAGWKVAH